MPDDGLQVQTLVEQWAAAVHAGDVNGVATDHSEDIVIFDVPPPHEGVRGVDAYRETWPAFFKWQAEGAVAGTSPPASSKGTLPDGREPSQPAD